MNSKWRGKGSSQGTDLLDLVYEGLVSADDPISESTQQKVISDLRNQLRQIPHLVVHQPNKSYVDVRLDNKEMWTIGRSADNDIVIQHPKVSRHHARIERRGDAFIVEDLNSSNGSWFNQKRFDTHHLHHADALQIGNTQLIFKSGKLQATTFKADSNHTYMPVVVVPGVAGSMLWRGTECIWPNVHTLMTASEKFRYAAENPIQARNIAGEIELIPRILTIESYGRIGDFLEKTLYYRRDEDLLEFSYDWRGDVRDSAQALAKMIDEWSIDGPIAIVAHSLGCLVSRYYVDCLGGDKRVGRQILMGGPNAGTPSIMLPLLSKKSLALAPLMKWMNDVLGEKTIDVLATFPSLHQILPTYPAIVDQREKPIDIYQETEWCAPERLDLLKKGHELHRELRKQSPVPTTCIFGYGEKTLTKLLVERGSRGSWETLHLQEEVDGDGFVPTQSAILKGADIHPVNQNHNDLYTDEDVLMRLRLELMG